MHRISRIYLANVGYRLAWYPGLLLPFTDIETNLPTQSIYNLANQGGKTTFLSLVFSVFDTKQDRFLQTLSNPGQHFTDYFDKDGLPGIICVEWDMPGATAQAPRQRFVTGQLVCLRKTGEGLTPERHFFSFMSTDTLTLESIPGPNLPGAANGQLRGRDDCVRWMHTMASENRGNFQHLTNQTDWKALLDSRGFDVELLCKQVDFNRREGAMDDAFLDFKTELDFVRRFLMLTLNQDKANETQQLVAALCRKMTNRKQLQDSLAQMERLGNAFRPFARAAEEYQAALNARASAEQGLGVASKTLEVHVAQHTEQANAQVALQKEKEAEQSDQSKVAVAAEADAEALTAEQLGRHARKAQDVALQADKTHKATERRVQVIGAAKLHSEVLSLTSEVNGLDHALAEANRGAEPLRKTLGEKSAVYGQMLADLSSEGRHTAACLRNDAQSAAKSEKQQEALKASAQQTVRAEAKKQTEASTRLADAALRRTALISSGVLSDEEQVADALARVTGEKATVTAEIGRFEQQAVGHEASAKELAGRALGLEKDNQPAKLALSQLEKEIREGETLRSEMSRNSVLAKAAGAENCNPDSEVLPVRVAELVRKEQERWRDAELTLSRLEEGQASYDMTELFGRDPDVARVVRMLSDNGVAGVRAYAEYLSHTVPKAQQARKLALSNPGRYLGVAVPTTKDVEISRGILEKAGLDLGRPVVVSAYSTDASPVDATQFILGPQDDSLWNRAAASERASKLVSSVEAASDSRDEAKKASTAAVRAKDRLDQYTLRFGNDKLGQLRVQASDAKEQLAAVEQQVAEMRQQAAGESEQAHRARAEASRLQKMVMPEIAGRLQTLQGYFNDWETKCADWEQDLSRAAGRKQVAETAEAAASLALEQARDLVKESKSQAERAEVLAAAHEQARKGLAQADASFDVAADLAAHPRSLPEVKAEYEAADAALSAAYSGTSATLEATRKVKASNLDSVRAKYSSQYPADRFPADEVASITGSDYADMEANARQAVEATDEARLKARDLATRAKADCEVQQRQRKHPAHVIVDVDAISEADIGLATASRLADGQSAAQAAQLAKDAAIAARSRAKELRDSAKTFEVERRHLDGLSLDFSMAVADVSRFADASLVSGEIAELTKALSSAQKAADTAEKRARQAYEAVTAIAMDDAFAKNDYEIATMLRENPLESSAADATRILSAIDNRIDALQHDLSKMADDFVRATNALFDLTNESFGILRRAVEKLRLPDHVPMVGGKSVIKMRNAVFTMSQEQKKQVLFNYMEELTADKNIPETGAQLAAQALMRLGDNRLGLKLLKMVEIEDEQYVPVDKMTHSGAEKLSMGLFLYFVTMRLRSEQRASSSRAESGVLLLDNPFAKATSRPIWVAIHSLAEAMGLQLIISTGMNEAEVLSVFKRHLRLGKTTMDKATGRLHIKVADYQFLHGEGKEAA